MLDGIQAHIDAVAAGESVEQRLTLINGSNVLSEEAKRRQGYFLKSFCLAAGIEPFCGGIVQLADGLTLHLNKPRRDLSGNELPGVRVDGFGDLVIEGDFYRSGQRCARTDARGFPLWPLILRNAPCSGAGPWENFRSQALSLLKDAGEQWPRQTLTA